MYGPTTTPTDSLLSIDADGAPMCYWDPGLPRGPRAAIPAMPNIACEIDIADVGKAVGSFPWNTRVLIDSPEEKVSQHFVSIGGYFGAHLVTEQRSDGLVAGYFMANTGTCNPAVPGSWKGMVRFKEVRLRLNTPGLVIVTPDGKFATSITIGGRGDWFAKSRAWFSQKLVVCTPALVPKAIALLQMNELNLQNGHPSLGPLGVKAPPLLNKQFEPLSTTIPPRQGPFWYDRDDAYDPTKSPRPPSKGMPDAPAGFRIDPHGGWEATLPAARGYVADVPRLLAGCPLALFDIRDGEPIRPDEWAGGAFEYNLTGDRLSYDKWNNPGGIAQEFGGPIEWVGAVQVAMIRRANPGLCANESLALAYDPFDDAHLIRILQGLRAAWWLARDWCAWLALRVIAMDSASGWALDGRPPRANWDPFSLERAHAIATNYPGHGDGYLRAQGWVMEAMGIGAALPYLHPAERRYVQGWRRTMNNLQELHVGPAGLSRMGLPSLNPDGSAKGGSDNGAPWLSWGMRVTSGACAAWQAAIHASGYASLVGGSKLRAYNFTRTLLRGLQQLLFNPKLPRVLNGTCYYVETSERDATGQYVPVPELKYGVGAAYNTVGCHDWHWLALAYLVTGDRKWVDEMPKLEQPYPTLAARVQAWRAKPTPWNALAIAVAESVLHP